MIDLKKFKDLFISEAEDFLQKLNADLLAFEKEPGNKNFLNELMRSAHTMKSSSAMMGYNKTAYLMHVMEDIFDYARNNILEMTTDIINELFKTFDVLRESLASIKKNDKESDMDPLIEELKKITGVRTSGAGKSPKPAEGKPVTGVPENKDSDAGELARNTPPVARSDSDETESPLKETVEKINHIKVPVERLDSLMDSMEELLIDKMRLKHIKKKDAELEEVVDHLSRLVSDIQYQVMRMRLVPVEQIFSRFPRMVRDLSEEQKKKIEFEIAGGELELDRTIIDKLGEPLVHLLRNAVDHGIDKVGTIKLKAMRERDFALIMVENNGNGIDLEKVKEAAIKKNIVSQKEMESFGKNQILNLIYHPGLSTSEQITEISGRGVGMGIVKNFAEEVGGRVIVDSPLPEGGVRFTLELPLTIAIINSLLVRVGDSVFAIPFSSIERSVTVGRKDIKSMADQDVAVVDGTDVPLVRLDKIFRLGDKPFLNPKFQNAGLGSKNGDLKSSNTVVLVRRGKDVAGLVVDNLLSEQEIIIKSFPSILRGAKGFSGSTILGDGKTILILDIISLLENTKGLSRV